MNREIKKFLISLSLYVIIFFISFIIALVVIDNMEVENNRLLTYWVIGFIDCALARTIDDWVDKKIK